MPAWAPVAYGNLGGDRRSKKVAKNGLSVHTFGDFARFWPPSVQKYGISWTDAAAGVPGQSMEFQEVEVTVVEVQEVEVQAMEVQAMEVQEVEVPGLGKRRTSAI